MGSVTVIYPGGRASFAPEFVVSFGSYERLVESDVLKRIPMRQTVLRVLWEESAAKAGKVAQRARNDAEKEL